MMRRSAVPLRLASAQRKPATPEAPEAAGSLYYGEPIDLAASISPLGAQIVAALAGLGMACYRPATAWVGGNWDPAYVERVNRQALYAADVMIADFSTGARSTGLPMEVEAAAARGIPVVVLAKPTAPLGRCGRKAGPWAKNLEEPVSIVISGPRSARP
jgi:hypothetical protein